MINLICPQCEKDMWEVKNDIGDILLHCKDCGNSAIVKNAGVKTNDFDGITYPQEKVQTKTGSYKFDSMTLRFPTSVKRLVQAATLMAKAEREIKGKAFAGITIGLIMADYISGYDWLGSNLQGEDLERVQALLTESANLIDEIEQVKNSYNKEKFTEISKLDIEFK